MLEEMNERGLRPNVIHFNIAMSACDQARQPERALALLAEMQTLGIEPSLISYNTAISACRWGQWERALSLLEEMSSRGIEPDVISYNSAIASCSRPSDSFRATSQQTTTSPK